MPGMYRSVRVAFRSLFLLILPLLYSNVFNPSAVQAQPLYKVEGRVVDAEKGTPLPSANIRLLGTSRGTISNREGSYLLRVEEGHNTLVFSYVGYISDTLGVYLRSDLVYEALLEPTLIPLPALTVSGDDPARAIIRRAIEAKERINRGLDSYRFQAFTRRTISREDSIAGILESYTFGYWRRGETLREQLRQSRITENLPDISGMQGVLAIQDFSQDDLELAGNRYVGPLHHNALRWYDYSLEEVKLQDGREIYLIAMEPRSKMVPLLRGTVEIADSTYALVGVDLVPAEPIVIPFVDDLQIEWKQRFQRQEQGYWLPSDVRTNGSLTVGIGPIRIPRIGFSQTSVIYDYDINIALSDSVFERSARVVGLPQASRPDSTFWQENEVLPLTREEEHAYTLLDSTQTLERLFAPPGFEMDVEEDALILRGSLGGRTAGGLPGLLDVRFNRVEGQYLGIRASRDSVAGVFEVGGRAGYGFSAERWSWEASLSARFGARPRGPNQPGSRGVGIGVSIYDRVAPSPSAGFYPRILNSLTAVLAKEDYFDYHASRGWRVDLDVADRPWLEFDLFYARETHRSLETTNNWSIFQGDKPSRANPPVSFEGAQWQRFGAVVEVGRPESLASVTTGKGLSVSAERGATVGSTAEEAYTRVDGVVSYSIPTFTSRFLFYPQLVARLAGGWSSGSLPRELWGAPENALGIYCPLGALRGADHRELAGTRYAVLTVEHNFRSLPFLLLGLRWLSNQGIELLVHGAIAQTWIGDMRLPRDRPYAEVGFGIGRLAELFRLDITRRLAEPRGWYLTLSLTTLL